MPSMSYELVAGADITCGSWMFSACCWNIRPYAFSTGMQVNVATPSLHLIGACLAIVVVFLNFFAGRFSNLALIYLRRISFMDQISCGVILILKIIQTGLIFRLSMLYFMRLHLAKKTSHDISTRDGLRTPPIYNFQISD